MWGAVAKAYPLSYGLIDEHMVLPNDTDYEWDEKFGPGEDKTLANWIVGYIDTYDGELADGASIHADLIDGYAAVTWTEDGREFVQFISLNPGDFEEIVLGADPVADGWEDGCGKLVCRANAEPRRDGFERYLAGYVERNPNAKKTGRKIFRWLRRGPTGRYATHTDTVTAGRR